MDSLAIEAAETSVNAGYPRNAAAILIVELDGESAQVEAEFEQLRQVMEQSGADEMRIAADGTARARIWKGRKGAFSAVGRLSPNYLVQDGVVPREQLGTALEFIEQASAKHRLRVANVFHAGDGNLHPLILYDGREAGMLERAEELASEILHMCISLGGTITGEHGVGLEKRGHMVEMFSDDDLELMRDVRLRVDPLEIANRGKMLPDRVKPEPGKAVGTVEELVAT